MMRTESGKLREVKQEEVNETAEVELEVRKKEKQTAQE